MKTISQDSRFQTYIWSRDLVNTKQEYYSNAKFGQGIVLAH
jgi:hypothetical protein